MGSRPGTNVLSTWSSVAERAAAAAAGPESCTNTTASAIGLPSGVVTRPESVAACESVAPSAPSAAMRNRPGEGLCISVSVAIAELPAVRRRIGEIVGGPAVVEPDVLEGNAMSQPPLPLPGDRNGVPVIAGIRAAIHVANAERVIAHRETLPIVMPGHQRVPGAEVAVVGRRRDVRLALQVLREHIYTRMRVKRDTHYRESRVPHSVSALVTPVVEAPDFHRRDFLRGAQREHRIDSEAVIALVEDSLVLGATGQGHIAVDAADAVAHRPTAQGQQARHAIGPVARAHERADADAG